MDKFDEYKFFVESTQHLSERRQSATQVYLTVHTAIFAALAFLIKDLGLQSWSLMLFSLPLFVVGAVVCVIWSKLITQYKDAVGWRHEQLIAMEQAMPESYQMYTKEKQEFFQPQRGKEQFGFSRLEIWLPRLFLGLYVLYGVGLATAIALH